MDDLLGIFTELSSFSGISLPSAQTPPIRVRQTQLIASSLEALRMPATCTGDQGIGPTARGGKALLLLGRMGYLSGVGPDL